ncbi:MAG: hypothetical protein ABSE42_14745 [Bryobacteraceae bacterium]|jgi:hypothetical protein
MKRACTVTALLLFLAALAWPAGLSGDWKGAFDFDGNSVPVVLHLTVKDAGVTGTIDGLPTSPADIKEGKIDGDTITFWVATDYQGTTYKLVFKGKVTDDEIHFQFGTEDGAWGADLVVKRAS